MPPLSMYLNTHTLEICHSQYDSRHLTPTAGSVGGITDSTQ